MIGLCRYCHRRVEGPDDEGDYKLHESPPGDVWHCEVAIRSPSPIQILEPSHDGEWLRHDLISVDEIKERIAAWL